MTLKLMSINRIKRVGLHLNAVLHHYRVNLFFYFRKIAAQSRLPYWKFRPALMRGKAYSFTELNSSSNPKSFRDLAHLYRRIGQSCQHWSGSGSLTSHLPYRSHPHDNIRSSTPLRKHSMNSLSCFSCSLCLFLSASRPTKSGLSFRL